MEPDSQPQLPSYKYQPLQGPSWIRVLRLHPSSSFDDSPKCDILHLNRNEMFNSLDPEVNQHDAISYVWGDAPKFSHSLTCGSTRIAITKDVHIMLRHFRKSSKARISSGISITLRPPIPGIGCFAIYGLAQDIHFEDLGEKRRSFQDRSPRDVLNRYSINAFIDYGSTVEDVYCRFAAHCVRAGRTLELLYHTLAFGSLRSRHEDLPSWVPDWSRPKHTNALTNWISLKKELSLDRAIHFPGRIPKGPSYHDQLLKIIEAFTWRVHHCYTEWSDPLTWDQLYRLENRSPESSLCGPDFIVRMLCHGVSQLLRPEEISGELRDQLDNIIRRDRRSARHVFLHIPTADREPVLINGRGSADADATEESKLEHQSSSRFYRQFHRHNRDGLLYAIRLLLGRYSLLVGRSENLVFAGLGPPIIKEGDIVVESRDGVLEGNEWGDRMKSPALGFALQSFEEQNIYRLLGSCLYMQSEKFQISGSRQYMGTSIDKYRRDILIR